MTYDNRKQQYGERSHHGVVHPKAERLENDAILRCHRMLALLMRWLLGTHAGAVHPKRLRVCLDECDFRHNRRKTNGVGRIAARVIDQLAARQPLPVRSTE